ncbi:DUF748 domain-containing protein [Candidatus Omnitrophota bacterium]
MKILLRIVVVLIVIIGLLLAAGYFFVKEKGRPLLVAQLEQALQRPVKIQAVSFSLPFSVKLDDIEIEDFVTADSLYIQPSIASLVSGRVVLSKAVLMKPQLTLRRLSDGSWDIPRPPVAQGQDAPETMPISINLVITDGHIEFIDEYVDPQGFRCFLQNVDAKIDTELVKLFTRFTMSAEICARQSQSKGKVALDGWLKFLNKDMKADITLSDIDGAYFGPYYQRFMGDRPIKTAKINSQINLEAENNMIDGTCHLEINDILFEEPVFDEALGEDINPFSMVMGLVAGETKDIVMDLPIAGQLYPFKIDMLRIGGTIGGKVVTEAIMQQPKKIPDSIKDIGEQFEDIGKEFQKVFEGMGE